MSEFKSTNDYSLVSIILPKLTGEHVVESLSKNGARHIIQSTSRGSMLNEGGGFLSKMFPPPAPEQELFQLLVPSAKLGDVMQGAVDAGYLNRAGSGAIFSMPCKGEVHHTDAFPLLIANENEGAAIGNTLAADMDAIICIVELGTADDMASAALKAGSSGPTITFGEGGGVRDKIRVLRLTKGPEKEIVIAVVEKGETDKVFTEMARAGKITEPGKGFMYTTPVNRGLINISSSFSAGGAGASLDQIIGALDELKGGKNWRSNVPAAGNDKGGGKTPLLTDLTELVGLFCLVHRDHYPVIYDAILDAGASGVSVVFGKLRDPNAPPDAANDEWASVQTSISPDALNKVRDAIEDATQRVGIKSACLFTTAIDKAATYIPN
jgi:nitrogen regulatory protein PII